jgi:hypothetical protein
MKRISRPITALLLLAVYAAVAMTPLAPLAMRAPLIAHAASRECVGDCAICGCSPEARANHACCCWKKKQQHDHERHHGQVADCCKERQHDKTVLSCGCPCGTKHLALWSGERYEQLPYRFNGGIPAFHADAPSSAYRKRLTQRHGEPPDPPPKIALFS